MDAETFTSFDGVRLAYRAGGVGRPVLLLHGFMANAHLNWIAPGVAGKLIDAGYRVIAPDARGHGASRAPDEDRFFPQDVLARDAEALIAHLALADYDLVAYSMGARAAVRMLVRGATPRRCVLGGLGDSGVLDPGRRIAYFRDAIVNGPASRDPEGAARMAQLMTWSGAAREQVLRTLETQPPTSAAELARIDTPILALAGAEDEDNGSAEALARLLPNARAQRTPGTHGTAVMEPAYAEAILAFLSEL
ncbi:MAG: alpha/beta hydrolase [Alphaproteobacteria bacterium]|nr:alpha/beta hydrolase [Alphaproteobacteria bacterium]